MHLHKLVLFVFMIIGFGFSSAKRMIVFPTTPLHQHFTLCSGLFHLFSRSGNVLHTQLSHSTSACSFQPQQPRWLGNPPLSCGTIVTFCFTSFHYGLLGQVEPMYHGTGVNIVASVIDKESDLGVDATFFCCWGWKLIIWFCYCTLHPMG